MIELPYGRAPLRFEPGDRHIEVIRRVAPAAGPLGPLISAGLSRPISSPELVAMARPGARVTVIVSDPTRVEPRGAFLAAIREHISDARWTLAIATGTHGPCRVDELGIPAALIGDARIVNHDGHRDDELVELGVTSAGTPMRVHRCVVDADLVIGTGCIRPHYFAGFGAGVKAIFPGLGQAAAIRTNHRWKTDLHARSGIVDGNPIRADFDEGVAFVTTPTFLINGVCSTDDAVQSVVAGDRMLAWRAGAERAREFFTVCARPAPLVIASDALPVTATLYQAAKIAAAAAPLVEPNGTLVIAAECGDGVGPLDVVNEAIFRIGVLPRLPPGSRVVLVSSLARETIAETLVEYGESIEAMLGETSGRVLVIPRASQLICEPSS